MNRAPVISSNIASIGWDSEPFGGTMEVEFTKGTIYVYYGVPYDVYRAVVTGSLKGSVGHTLYVLVKLPGFPYERIK